MPNATSTLAAGAATESRPFEHILFPRNSIHEDAGLLARFLAGLQYEDIPNDVIQTAKLITLDTLGCIVAGTDTPLGEKILAAYEGGFSSNGCGVPGTSLKLAPSLAAKVNAWLADVLDYEDDLAGHPSATVIPAALAMAEHVGAAPQQFLLGVVAGYEAGVRVHDATQASPEVYRRFAVYHAWHGIAAGAAAMAVAGGTEEQFRSALGHAAANTNIPIWYVQYGRPAHALKANYGQMALGGFDAAICARRNIVGPFAMLSDAARGFALIIGSDQFQPKHLSADLSVIWRTRESTLKAYPCCAFLHTTIEGILKLVAAHNIQSQNVAEVCIRTFKRIPEWFSDAAPASGIDAQLSVQYASAMALLSVEVGRDWYSPAMMQNPIVSDLMQRIKIEVDPIADKAFWDIGQNMSSVTIVTRNGQSFSMTIDWPDGHWKRQRKLSESQDKFRRNVRGTSLEKRADDIVELVMNIDKSKSLDELWGLLSASPSLRE